MFRKTMNKNRILYFVIAILIGGFMFVYGGIDDSPGGQLIGILMIIIGVVGITSNKKKASS